MRTFVFVIMSAGDGSRQIFFINTFFCFLFLFL